MDQTIRKSDSSAKQVEFQNSLHPERWVDNYADQLFGYAFTRLGDEQDAEDIVQSTFLSAWHASETYTGEASEKTWLYAICKNKIIDEYRKRKRIEKEEEPDSAKRNRNRKQKQEVEINESEVEIYFDHTGHWTETAAPTDWETTVEHPGEQREFFKVFELCISKLKTIQQQVFSLKYLEDMDADEICKILEITNSNYWVLIHRAKLHLRACLEKNWLHLK